METINQKKFKEVFGNEKLFVRHNSNRVLEIYNDKISPPMFIDHTDDEFIELHITEIKPWKRPRNEEPVITKTKAEIQSGSDRQSWAESLILQLPKDHDGRNSWLLNYGVLEEAINLRENHNNKPKWSVKTWSAQTIK